MKTNLSLFFVFFLNSVFAQSEIFTEPFRPQFHFSTQNNWINDPNGLVFNKGEYHLFCQYNPFGNVWGHMSWAHAVSRDLIYWKEMPIAIPEENGIMIFSGTCVVDKRNTSGFATEKNQIPMVAVYTGSTDTNQSQHIAYSLDNGIIWKKYAGNPVLDLHKKDFRDPKVFWYEPSKKWMMCLMFPVEHEVKFYESNNLIDWKYVSSFGPAGDTSGVWECPDLFEVPVEGNLSEKKWVLSMSMNGAMQYFIGSFKGGNFFNENNISKINRPDYGPDYYAAIAYNQLPDGDSPIMIGWVNNWFYANDIPTNPWKGAMSIPRTISVKKINGEWVLIQKPLKTLEGQRRDSTIIKGITFGNHQTIINLPLKSTQIEMDITLKVNETSISGIRLAVGGIHYFEIGYDAAKHKLYIDRSHCANQSFNPEFKKMKYFETELIKKDGEIHLNIFFDNSIVEVFGNDGEAVLTAQIFPGKNDNSIQLFSSEGQCSFPEVKIWKMQSIGR